MNLTKINSLIKFNQITKRTMTTKANKLIKLSKFGVSNYTSLVIYGTNLSSTVNKGRCSEPPAGETVPPPGGKV